MNNNERALDRIESAIDRRPLCACGQPTDVVARPDGMWLICSSQAAAGDSLRRRFAGLWFGHTRRLVLDGRDGLLNVEPGT